jgi:hypothetical protein
VRNPATGEFELPPAAEGDALTENWDLNTHTHKHTDNESRVAAAGGLLSALPFFLVATFLGRSKSQKHPNQPKTPVSHLGAPLVTGVVMAMERSCAVARGTDTSMRKQVSKAY